MSTFVQLFLSFEGRMRRRDFWLCLLALAVAHGILQSVTLALFWPFTPFSAVYVDGDFGAWSSWAWTPWVRAWPVLGLINLVLLWPRLALCVKRYHDRDKTGFWLLIGLIPLIGWAWLIIELGFLDGTPGSNRYGPSPKGVGGAAPTAAAFS
jgi:uncharacterized membrane protein YhaH (DUF805 family)